MTDGALDLDGVTVIPARKSRACFDGSNRFLPSFMQRNSAHVSEYFRLPRDSVVELGREVTV
jgi:hypothetical protein